VAIESGYCLFHDEKYLTRSKENEETARQRLLTKIDHCMSYGESLSCIGYHIPSIEVKNKTGFSAPVNFSDAIFHGITTFSNLSFGESDFTNAVFNGVTFNTVVFAELH
jgi:hypothetical protein